MNINNNTETSNDVDTESSVNSQEEVVEKESDNSLDYFENDNDQDNELSNEEDDIEDDDSDTAEHNEPKVQRGVQKRINKLTKKNADLSARLEELEARLKEKQTDENSGENKTQSNNLNEPDISDYDDYSLYLKDQLKYERAVAKKEDEEAIRIKAQEQANQKKWSEYTVRMNEAKKLYGEKNWSSMKDIDLVLDNDVQEEILTSDYGPHVLYYLYKNVDEAKTLNGLSQKNKLKAIISIENKLKDKINIKKSKVSSAPDPINGISKSKTSKVNLTTYKSFKEFKAMREKK